MQVSLRFPTLLAGLIILLFLHAVDSLSISRRSEPQLFTLALKPIPQPSNIHPQILLQMHINRGIRRLAKMTGAEPPSERNLQQRLEKRILSLDLPTGVETRRRFNRRGVHNVGDDVQLEKRFNRFGVSKHRRQGTEPQIKSADTPTAPNSLGFEIQGNDVGYLAVVQIGTPPRDFTMIMDSGSADFWVGADSCEEVDVQGNTATATGKGCGNHNFLGSGSSASFTDLSQAFIVRYGKGAVSGNITQDNVSIAGLTLSNHTFGVANKETIEFTTQSLADGLMGLAQSSLSNQRTLTPIEALKSAGLVPSAIVSYKLGRVEDEKNDGQITFGGADPTKFDPNNLVNLPNINKGFWECNMDAISVNGNVLNLTNRTSVLDTGTTLMILPLNDAEVIHSNIPGSQTDNQGGFIVPCNTNASVALTYGGKSFTIDPRDIVRGPINQDNILCVSGIAGSSLLNDPLQWLVGDTFLKNVYFSTNVDNNTLSLANLV